MSKYILIFFLLPFSLKAQEKDSIVYIHGKKLELLNTISGRISPKSVVASGNGLFFAQNMMYKHTITVYNRKFELVKTIPDNIKLSDYGFSNHKGNYKGSPVECVFTHNGKYAWVSNYEMTGGTSREFVKPGCDACNSATKYDSSYVYKINTTTFEIEKVIVVGAVPKFLAATPNNQKVLVTNWSSGDISIIDTKLNKEIKRVALGRFPRGIVINKSSSIAYIAIMGSTKIAKLNLFDYTIQWIPNIGSHPRHLCLSPDDKMLYVSLNGEGRIAKLNLVTNEITKKATGRLPRSMDISADGKFLYVVNYGSNEVTKLETSTMKILARSKTKSKPIGITFDKHSKNIWTACYSGRIMVFHDTYYDSIAVNVREQERLLVALAKKETEKKRKNSRGRTSASSKPIENKLINGKYILVSGSFATSSGARRRLLELKNKGVIANLYFNESNGRNYAYLKAFNSRDEAQKYSKEQIVDSWIYNLPKEAQITPEQVIKEIPRESSKSVIKKEASVRVSEDLPFLIISGSFKDKRNAQTRVMQLKRINKTAFVYFNPKNNHYYACLSSFISKENAIKYLKSTSEEGWVYKR